MPMMMTPESVAERYGVNFTTVLGWIARGLMPAVDVSRDGSSRRRWRMTEEHLAAFNSRRASQPPAAASQSTTRKRTRASTEPTKDYFGTTERYFG